MVRIEPAITPRIFALRIDLGFKGIGVRAAHTDVAAVVDVLQRVGHREEFTLLRPVALGESFHDPRRRIRVLCEVLQWARDLAGYQIDACYRWVLAVVIGA